MDLTNILYVTNFSFNLIFVSKLTSSLNCELTFSYSECIIHDMKTKEKNDLVDLVYGLYVFLNPFLPLNLILLILFWIKLLRILACDITDWT